MYTIKQASLRCGVGVPLIRAWERRYRVLRPRRTAAGYRMYDDDAIATLTRIRQLTEAGWSASEASRAVLAGEVAVISAPPVVETPESSDLPGHLARGLVEAAGRMDPHRLGVILDEMLARGSFEMVVDDLLMPALAALGEAWADGSLDVAGEHAASAAIHRRLSALYEAAAAVDGPRAVIGLPPGARHELGALAFGVALRRQRASVLYLGPDVPVASWAEVMGDPRHILAVIGVVREDDRPAALEVIRAIRGMEAPATVALGGRASHWDEASESGAIVLPERVADAARRAREMTGPSAFRAGR